VLGDFEWKQLVLTDIKFGKMIAGIRSVHYPSAPTEYAIGSDVLDLAIIEFDPELRAEFFKGTAYLIDLRTAGTATVGHDLVVNGLFKDSTTIDELKKISPTFGLIEFTERGPSGFDMALRKAEGAYVNPPWRSLTGFSGAPVFDITAKRLCGMVVRATMPARDRAIVHYIDIVDIMEALKAVADGTFQAKYKKIIAVPRVRSDEQR
jgi:hypothetical protein